MSRRIDIRHHFYYPTWKYKISKITLINLILLELWLKYWKLLESIVVKHVKKSVPNSDVKFKTQFWISHHSHCNTVIKRHLLIYFLIKISEKINFICVLLLRPIIICVDSYKLLFFLRAYTENSDPTSWLYFYCRHYFINIPTDWYNIVLSLLKQLY